MEVLVALKNQHADVETFAASPLAPAVTLQQLVLRREAGRDVGG